MPYTEARPRRFMHLTKHHDGIGQHPGLLHLAVKFFRLPTALADAAKQVEISHQPTLSLVYLPHLDYYLQRYGTQDPRIQKDLQEIDSVVGELVTFYESQNIGVILLSEYGITDVNQPIHLNRIFREKGWLQIREERGLELLDAGASKVFAVADHQLAHVYVNEPSLTEAVKEVLEGTPGIEKVLHDHNKGHLEHDRSGDLIAVADSESWFTYYFWLDDRKAPDFARTVDIHRKPGYDPVELFVDPRKPGMMFRVLLKLIRKKLGFRTLMDVIPLDAGLVKGSHGRIPENKEDHPILITNRKGIFEKGSVPATAVRNILEAALKPTDPHV